MKTNCTVVTSDGKRFRGLLGHRGGIGCFDVSVTPEIALKYWNYAKPGKVVVHSPVFPHHIIPDSDLVEFQADINQYTSEGGICGIITKTFPISSEKWHEDYYASSTPEA